MTPAPPPEPPVASPAWSTDLDAGKTAALCGRSRTSSGRPTRTGGWPPTCRSGGRSRASAWRNCWATAGWRGCTPTTASASPQPGTTPSRPAACTTPSTASPAPGANAGPTPVPPSCSTRRGCRADGWAPWSTSPTAGAGRTRRAASERCSSRSSPRLPPQSPSSGVPTTSFATSTSTTSASYPKAGSTSARPSPPCSPRPSRPRPCSTPPAQASRLAYLPAGEDVGVGGDWHDVLALPDGRVLLVIGDIAGRGMQAAAWTGQMRSAVRAYARQNPDPERVLAECAELVAALGLPDMITLGCGLLDLTAGRVRWASAGHPAPLMLRPGRGAVLAPQQPGPPLGLGPLGHRATDLAIDPGGALVLDTDGAVEDRRRSLDEGIADLLATAPDPGRGAAAVVRTLAEHVAGRGGEDDDVALLVVRRI